MIDPLKPENLYGACDLQQFSFQTTDELESLTGIFGQARVVGAVQFGIGIQQHFQHIVNLVLPAQCR